MTRVHLGRFAVDEAGELAITHALLREASAGAPGAGEVVRVYSPAAPTVVFGRRDTRLPGFAAAVAAARAAGFATAVRVVGGRAVAYSPCDVVVDRVRRDVRAVDDMDHRFETFGRQCAAALTRHGIDARVGPVPGEYCPGEHSVNGRGKVKLVGTAQRVVHRAWLFSALLVVDRAEPVREVLTEVYARLGLPFRPESVGSLREESPGLTTAYVVEQVLDLCARGARIEADLPPEVRVKAARLLGEHRIGPRPGA